MSFDDRLRQAIERGQKRGEARAHEAQKKAMTEEECKRLHSQLRLRLSEQIEACIKRLPNVFPGFQYETIYNIRYFRNLFDYFFNKNWDYTDSGIMDKTHFRFFTYKSIRKMFESNGYEVVKMEGINPTKSIRPLIWNIFLLGSFWDIRFLQFATIAKVK